MPDEISVNRKITSRNISGVKGVGWDQRRSKWRVWVYINDVQFHIGYFKTLEAAIEARRKADQ
jgi:hypothetical protein